MLDTTGCNVCMRTHQVYGLFSCAETLNKQSIFFGLMFNLRKHVKKIINFTLALQAKHRWVDFISRFSSNFTRRLNGNGSI
jgi:hypothetical protein